MKHLKANVLLVGLAVPVPWLVVAAAASSGGGLVCAPPIPHTTQCYRNSHPLGSWQYTTMAECCTACSNTTGCTTWVHKGKKCLLLPATAKRSKTTGCESGTSVPSPKPPGPPPSPPGPKPPRPGPATDPLNPKLPPNRWGAYTGRKSELAPEYGFVSGFDVGCGWGDVEAVQGHFNFSVCEAAVQQALAQNKYISLGPGTGSSAPLHWMEKAGVPIVKVCFKDKNTTCPAEDIRTYPYYFAPAYFPLWRKYMQALHDWVKQLPKNKQGLRPIQSMQVKLGSTGDITPWHGHPLDSKYTITGDEWKTFWVNGSRTMWDIHRDLLPDTKLMFNGVPTNSTPDPSDPDAKYWPDYHDLIFNVIKPPNFDMKQGVVSHEYMTSYELDDWLSKGNITRHPYVNAAGVTEFVRTRGESSDGGIKPGKGPVGGPGVGFWMNPTWNLLAMMCWDITYGLDIQSPNPGMWSEENGQNKCPPAPAKCYNWTKTLWRGFQHFHTHAGQKVVGEAPGGWLQLRDALDYSDTDRFPVAQFGGPVNRSNTARLQKIVAQYSSMGAGVDDVASATGSRHFSRSRKGINNAGWRIWPHNYGKWMTQLDPVGTSVGRWRVGSETNLLGQSTRQPIPGKNMSFALAPGLFGGKAPAAGLYVRVGYFDEGHGSWELHYASTAAGGGAMKLAAHVSKQDTQEFIEIRLKLTDDFDLELAHGGAAHFALVDSDAAVAAPGLGRDGGWASSDPDAFAWIEVLERPFVYQMAEVVHEVGAVVSAERLTTK